MDLKQTFSVPKATGSKLSKLTLIYQPLPAMISKITLQDPGIQSLAPLAL